jgi:hypothetical protein
VRLSAAESSVVDILRGRINRSVNRSNRSKYQQTLLVSLPYEGGATVGARQHFDKPSNSVVQVSTNNSKICPRASPKKGTPRANIFTNPISQFSQSVVQIVTNNNTITTYLTSEQHSATQHIALGPPKEMFVCAFLERNRRF